MNKLFLKDGIYNLTIEQKEESSFLRFCSQDIELKMFSFSVVDSVFENKTLQIKDHEEALLFCNVIGNPDLKKRVEDEIYVKDATLEFERCGYITGKIKCYDKFNTLNNINLKNYLHMRHKFDKISEILNHPQRISDYVSDRMYYDTEYRKFLSEQNIIHESRSSKLENMIIYLQRILEKETRTTQKISEEHLNSLFSKYEKLDSGCITSEEFIKLCK
jgi:hypothetical protein